MVDKLNILKGRVAVDAYREAHSLLHSKVWSKGVPEAHTPLLNTMIKGLKEEGFNNLREFFESSHLFNLQELGLEGKELDGADRIALEGKWH